jgi:cytochrome P450
MTLARSARPETEIVFDPSTYVDGVPFEALARLRTETPVAWVAETPVLGWPAGPGFWLVLRHTDVESVLARPQLFSSSLGATQIRDPATPQALGYVRQMMLNMDPPRGGRSRSLRTVSAVMCGPSATGCSPARGVNATSPRTWPRICRC